MCRSCSGNAQIDKLLQTPKDEVTHFGACGARRLQREAEHTLLFACHIHKIYERSVLQRILDFLRVPFITSYSGMHYCELCDEAFEDVFAKRHLRTSASSATVDWTGCPGQRFFFAAGESYAVEEFRKAGNGRWFFKTQVLQRRPDHVYGMPMHQTWFEPRWAPLLATAEGRELPTVADHLQSERHRVLETSVSGGGKVLVNHAALRLSRCCNENPTTSLSRLRDGLGVTGRFCTPDDVQSAQSLERVRDVGIPMKTLRDVFPGRRDQQLLWLTRTELLLAEEDYRVRSKKGSRRIC